MITASMIICLILLLLSVAMLLGVLFTDKMRPVKFRKFFAATTIVYITGNILITTINMLNSSLPVIFTVISESVILVVYSFSMFMIHKLGTSFEDISNANKKENTEEIL
ncbi:MAG: hypothetical protein J6U54_19335 [Clostridiales bacterium]|nr:hypothetical protein [Clostridiales bacterium]